MPKNYDVEDLVKDIDALLKAQLDTKVAAVEAAQVAAGLPAADPLPVPAEAYHQFAWNDEALNHAVGVMLAIAEQSSEGVGAFTQQRFVIDVGVYLSGTSNDPTATRKLLRYAKALKELFEENWGSINSAVTREKVETVGPIDFRLNVDSADDNKIAGVSVACTLG